MSTFDVKVFAGSVQTVEEFEALLEKFKVSNPAKYQAKLATGEFDKFRKLLAGGDKAVEVSEVEETTEEATEKPRRGRPAKQPEESNS